MYHLSGPILKILQLQPTLANYSLC